MDVIRIVAQACLVLAALGWFGMGALAAERGNYPVGAYRVAVAVFFAVVLGVTV